MKKETIICIVVVIVIVMGNVITQKYTRQSVEILSNELEDLKTNLNGKIDKTEEEEKLNEEISKAIDKVKGEWESRHDKLAYYIEHNELEKVEDNLTGLDSLIRTEDYPQAIEELDKCVFVLKHIQEKYAFNLENIF